MFKVNINLISYGKNFPDEFNVIIEIPAFSSPIKYEIDKHSGALVVDRFIGTLMQYPANYGFVPHTLSEDGDPVDVLVITPFPLTYNSVISARAIGVLCMEDESGIDAKIIALPTKKICQLYDKINTISDLPKIYIDQIKYFFQNYKGLEMGKWVKISDIKDIDFAKNELKSSAQRYKQSNKE